MMPLYHPLHHHPLYHPPYHHPLYHPMHHPLHHHPLHHLPHHPRVGTEALQSYLLNGRDNVLLGNLHLHQRIKPRMWRVCQARRRGRGGRERIGGGLYTAGIGAVRVEKYKALPRQRGVAAIPNYNQRR